MFGGIYMLIIRPSLYLKNNYEEVSEMCHQTESPVYITRNGTGDLAVMSIEAYEALNNTAEIYKAIVRGTQENERKRVKPTKENPNDI